MIVSVAVTLPVTLEGCQDYGRIYNRYFLPKNWQQSINQLVINPQLPTQDNMLNQTVFFWELNHASGLQVMYDLQWDWKFFNNFETDKYFDIFWHLHLPFFSHNPPSQNPPPITFLSITTLPITTLPTATLSNKKPFNHRPSNPHPLDHTPPATTLPLVANLWGSTPPPSLGWGSKGSLHDTT